MRKSRRVPCLVASSAAWSACFTAWCVCDTLSALPRRANERFHVIEIPLERAASGGSESVLRLRHPALERFSTGYVFRFLKLPGVDAQITVGRLHQLLEIAEAERIVDSESADDAEP